MPEGKKPWDGLRTEYAWLRKQKKLLMILDVWSRQLGSLPHVPSTMWICMCVSLRHSNPILCQQKLYEKKHLKRAIEAAMNATFSLALYVKELERSKCKRTKTLWFQWKPRQPPCSAPWLSPWSPCTRLACSSEKTVSEQLVTGHLERVTWSFLSRKIFYYMHVKEEAQMSSIYAY